MAKVAGIMFSRVLTVRPLTHDQMMPTSLLKVVGGVPPVASSTGMDEETSTVSSQLLPLLVEATNRNRVPLMR